MFVNVAFVLCFPRRNLCQEQVALFVSVATTFYSFAPSATKVLLGQCSRVALLLSNSLANQKLTFDERISCITRHDDFSSRSHRAVSLQVAPFLRDFKGRDYRHRAGPRKTSDYKVIWFKFISNKDLNREKCFEFKCSIAN